MQALLIGKRAKILTNVADRLRAFGWQVTLDNELDMQQLLNADVSQVSVVAFGRALSKEQKDILTQHYRQLNNAIIAVEGLAPIPELLVYQILAAARPITGQGITDAKLATDGPVQLQVKAFRLNWLYQVKTKEVEIPLAQNGSTDFSKIFKGFPFIVLEMNGRYSVISNR